MTKALSMAALAAAAIPAYAADVGVSLSIGQPGFYGQIDIGNYPQPQLIYAQPVLIEPTPVYGPPVYLHVPPGHARHWAQHCAEYGACGRHVYFVRDTWYNGVYVPEYQRRHGGGGPPQGVPGEGHGRGHGNDHGRGHGHGKD